MIEPFEFHSHDKGIQQQNEKVIKREMNFGLCKFISSKQVAIGAKNNFLFSKIYFILYKCLSINFKNEIIISKMKGLKYGNGKIDKNSFCYEHAFV